MLCLSSCRMNQEKTPQDVSVEEAVQDVFTEQNTYSFEEELTDVSKEKIKDWVGYFKLTNFLKEQYGRVSPQTALEMSEELQGIVGKIRDSLKINELKTHGFDARLNVLNSEVLRLKDMSEITSIKAEEVRQQIEKIIAVYHAINSKINAIYARELFDEEVNFNEEIFDFQSNRPTVKKGLMTKTQQKRR